jgi:hypothetical protein
MARYELKQGKFGPYFYDQFATKKMDLEEVLDHLNEGAQCRIIAEKAYQLKLAFEEVEKLRNERP